MSAVLKEETFEQQDSVEQPAESFVSKPLDPNRQKFNLAQTEFTINVDPYPQLKKKNKKITQHLVRRPTFEEEERKERMTPLLTRAVGKVGDIQAQQTQVDISPGDNYLYGRIVKKIAGYGGIKTEDPDGWADPQTIVTVRDPDTGEMVDKPLVEAVPEDHKSLVVNSLFPSNPNSFEIVDNDEVVEYSISGGQQWTIRQFIGGREQLEDGTFSEPDYTLEYTFYEPSANDLKAFRTKAFAIKNWNDKNGAQNEERRIILPVLTGLFDKLIASLDGAVVATENTGEDFNARSKEHVALVPPSFKKNAMLKLFSFLQADLGKSQSA
jgi:hypothetical protein